LLTHRRNLALQLRNLILGRTGQHGCIIGLAFCRVSLLAGGYRQRMSVRRTASHFLELSGHNAKLGLDDAVLETSSTSDYERKEPHGAQKVLHPFAPPGSFYLFVGFAALAICWLLLSLIRSQVDNMRGWFVIGLLFIALVLFVLAGHRLGQFAIS
jgi:hypothetical protein